ncbi:MAG: hypothetical protein JRJ40_11500 [Deltaproteobacteria bacterium]|nr:hypothetical protein [Deltaproteobacteria bacterium]
MTEREKAYDIALTILKKLTPEERGWLRQANIGGVEERAFRDAYHTWMGEEWKETPEIIFILTEDDAQIVAQDMIGRSLTENELYDVSRGVQAGLDDWGEIMRIAIRGVTGEAL